MITIWVPKRLVEIDLYNVAAQSPAALAEMSEKSYRQRVAYAMRESCARASREVFCIRLVAE